MLEKKIELNFIITFNNIKLKPLIGSIKTIEIFS